MPQVLDCFTFYNEIDLLEIRLHHLWEFVDFFVLVEATTTHSGNPKPLYYEENKSRFQWAKEKIIHVKAELPSRGTRWARENLQRQFVLHGLTETDRGDFVIIGDCDEIPSRWAANAIRSIGREIYGLQQKVCGWYVNWHDPRREWVGSVVTRMANLWETKSPQYLRDNRFLFPRIPNGGCHFTFVGDVPGIISKIGAFAHVEFDTEQNRDPGIMEARRELGLDPFGRDGTFEGQLLDPNDVNFPTWLRDHKDQYPHLFKRSAVQAADAIQGWMKIPELEWLAMTAESRKIIIEVGSWKGRSTKALAHSTPGVVYAVDHFAGSADERSSTHAEASRRGHDAIYEEFRANLANEILVRRVVPVRSDSLEAIPLLQKLLGEKKADMIFIDCDHSCEAVKRDILAYRPLLAEGGILCGHDYEEGGPGVIRAVNELVPGFSRGAGTIWYR